MKKWLVTGFLLVAAMSFAAEKDHAGQESEAGDAKDAMLILVNKPGAEAMESEKTIMAQYLSIEDRDEVLRNRAEIKTLLESKNPDWKRIESLNDKNALIMAKAKTKILQEKHKK